MGLTKDTVGLTSTSVLIGPSISEPERNEYARDVIVNLESPHQTNPVGKTRVWLPRPVSAVQQAFSKVGGN